MCCPLPQRCPRAAPLRQGDSILLTCSARVVSHHLGGLLRDLPLRRPCSPRSEERSERRPKTSLVASLPAYRAEARQPFIGRAHRVGLVASRLPSWGSLHFAPRASSHEYHPCSLARIRDDLLGHQLGCPASVDPSRARPCVGLSRRTSTPSPAGWPGPNR
jgi:hypothetical protein